MAPSVGGLVVAGVVSARHNFEVFDTVVELVLVDVMNQFVAGQHSAESLAHHQPVFGDAAFAVGHRVVETDPHVDVSGWADAAAAVPAIALRANASGEVLACHAALAWGNHGFKGITKCQ